MVDVMGHVAMGLLWAAPVWFLWSRRVSLAFLGIVAGAALLPDVDLWIEKLAPAVIHHHGITHTVVFVAVLSLAVGAVVATQRRPLDRWLWREPVRPRTSSGFVSVAVLIGGLSHLFADVLSSPDISQPLEPFWPVYPEPVIVDLIWYNAPLWNVGLLAVTLLLHLLLALLVQPLDHPYRITDE